MYLVRLFNPFNGQKIFDGSHLGSDSFAVYANYIGPLVMTDAN